MSTENNWLRRITDAAEANGWFITGFDANLPGSYVTLTDAAGVQITITDRGGYGLLIEQYIARLPAIERNQAVAS